MSRDCVEECVQAAALFTRVVPLLGFFRFSLAFPPFSLLTLRLPGVTLGTPYVRGYRTCDAVPALDPPAKHNLWQP